MSSRTTNINKINTVYANPGSNAQLTYPITDGRRSYAQVLTSVETRKDDKVNDIKQPNIENLLVNFVADIKR